jgi:hypothetical protein
MHARTAAAVAALLLATLTACGSSSETDTKPSSAPKELTQAQRDSARTAAGLPPGPSAKAQAAFISDLNTIDPRIVKPGKDDQAVSRGINQCGSIKTSPKDRKKLVELTLDRFTITSRFPEISTPAVGGKILDAVHKRLCPDF